MVVVRADSSNLIGSGHIMRCLTLAQLYHKDGHSVSFICRNLEGNLAGLITNLEFKLYMLPAAKKDDSLIGYGKWLTVTQEQDAVETVALLQKMGKIDRLVVDSYAIDETWEQLVRPYTDEIFVIDDLANRRHDCDILLDQNFYLNKEERYAGLVPINCQLLLGPKYALLRDEFYKAKEKMKSRDGKLHNILVFYGGVDATDETSKAIQALTRLISNGILSDVEITVVVGASNVRKDDIANLCHKADFKILCQVNNMADLMAEADLMLGAGGTTTWERCFLCLPAIVTAVAENQLKVCEDCAAAGLLDYLGFWDKVTLDGISAAVRKFISPEMRLSMQNKMSQLFDGRIVSGDGMDSKLHLCPVTMDDAKTIFDWANDPAVRQNSFNMATISWLEHRPWMECILEDKNTLFFLMKDHDAAVGQIRLAFKDGKWQISYSIAPAYRGHGYGKIILQLAETELIRGGHVGEQLYAEVKKDNIASQRIFKKLGYSEATSQHDNAYAYSKVVTKEHIHGTE